MLAQYAIKIQDLIVNLCPLENLRNEFCYHEWGVVTQGQQPKANTVEHVDHASNTGVDAKSDDALALLADHSLVIDQSNILNTNEILY